MNNWRLHDQQITSANKKENEKGKEKSKTGWPWTFQNNVPTIRQCAVIPEPTSKDRLKYVTCIERQKLIIGL
jgi:hypothetical protein